MIPNKADRLRATVFGQTLSGAPEDVILTSEDGVNWTSPHPLSIHGRSYTPAFALTPPVAQLSMIPAENGGRTYGGILLENDRNSLVYGFGLHELCPDVPYPGNPEANSVFVRLVRAG